MRVTEVRACLLFISYRRCFIEAQDLQAESAERHEESMLDEAGAHAQYQPYIPLSYTQQQQHRQRGTMAMIAIPHPIPWPVRTC